MLLDKIRELNEKLYQMCGELHKNKDFVGEYQDEVLSRVFELYKFDYEIIRLGLIDENAHLNELKRREELMTPTCKRVWYAPWKKRRNRAAELLEEEAMLKAKEFFDHKEEALRQLEVMIQEADNMTTAEAMEEPKEGGQEEEVESEQTAEQKLPPMDETNQE